jgi:hypothetical protein
VNRWSAKTEIAVLSFLRWVGIAASKWHNWKGRYGKANEHNAWIPRDHWLEPEEKQAILDFHDLHPLEGYRRLTFMMLDADVVACSPASVYRVLKAAGSARAPPSRPARARGSSNRYAPTSTGTSMSPTSTSPAPSTTCAACSTATAAPSSTGRSARR